MVYIFTIIRHVNIDINIKFNCCLTTVAETAAFRSKHKWSSPEKIIPIIFSNYNSSIALNSSGDPSSAAHQN